MDIVSRLIDYVQLILLPNSLEIRGKFDNDRTSALTALAAVGCKHLLRQRKIKVAIGIPHMD